ncbi:MAG: CcoQ/FixQ family Cbb3-type cytochrome c oxidase assembly chaperone [Gammaproteobacteria bacterium]|jgi:cytochrome c oxidase cbb3-type subunit 4
MGWLFSTWTVLVGVVFLGVVVWALSRKRTAEFDEAARIPLEDDDDVKDVNGDNRNG